MSSAWLLGSVSLFVTTVGALLIFLYLSKAPQFADQIASDDARRAYQKHRRLLTVSVGLLAGWLLIQYLGVILI